MIQQAKNGFSQLRNKSFQNLTAELIMSDEQTIVYIYFPGAKLKLAMTHTVFKKSPKSHTPLVFAK